LILVRYIRNHVPVSCLKKKSQNAKKKKNFFIKVIKRKSKVLIKERKMTLSMGEKRKKRKRKRTRKAIFNVDANEE